MAAQRVHAAAGHAHVAEQELDHGRGADVLRAHRVLGPAQGVQAGQGAVRRGGGGDDLAHLEEGILGRAADVAHRFRRVAGIVLLEQLQHATGVVQGLVHLGIAVRPIS